MARLRGTGLGSGMALGTAAIVRKQSGVPLMPEPPARLNEPAARRAAEKPEVILVAEDYQTALMFAPSLSWATVTGIAVEQPADGPVSPLPAVVGAAGLLQAAVEDVLILVDATVGVIFVDPDAMYLAQYTAERTRFAPKHRIFLDELHQPAQTINGRTITIIADAGPDSVRQAVDSGADAIYHELPLTFDSVVLRNHLARVMSIAAGKNLLCNYNSFLPLLPIVEAAAVADITLVVPARSFLETDPAGVASLTAGLSQAQGECLDNDTLCGMPRVGAEIVLPSLLEDQMDGEAPAEDMSEIIGALVEQGATRLVFSGKLDTARQFNALETICTAAGANLVPAYYLGRPVSPEVALTPDTEEPGELPAADEPGLPAPDEPGDYGLRLLLGAGVSGMLVENGDVAKTKSALRQMSDGECREFLDAWIARSN